MRLPIAAAGALACGLAAGALAAESNLLTPTAFVGTYVSDREIDCQGEDPIETEEGSQLIVMCMDSVWEMTYDVEKVLEGSLMAGSRVTFTAADHYGYPGFAEHKRALIYLGRSGDNYYHIKYAWNPAYRTVDGDFADCGCPKADETGVRKDPGDTAVCRNVAFSPPVKRDLSHLSKHAIDEMRASLDYQIKGEEALCVRGVYVEDVYREERPELLEQLNDE